MRWIVRTAVIVLIVLSVFNRVTDIVVLLALGEYPRERTVVFTAIDSMLLDLTWGALAWRWWGR